MSWSNASWYEATARQRIHGLADPQTFREFLDPGARRMSPHLATFDLPRAFDDGMIVGCARLDGEPVLIAAQEGRFMGGSMGEAHAAKLTGLLRGAALAKAAPVLILFDTGGVRLQEANAGETAIAEIMRAMLEARLAGVRVIGLIGGRAGCFGGGSLIAGCCSALGISEQGRIGVSGPEVIETNRGVEEFDASDRPLVWRTMGGKHRALLGGVELFLGDAVEDFRLGAMALLHIAGDLNAEVLRAEQARLEARIRRFGECGDGQDVWGRLGVDEPQRIPDLDAAQFTRLLGEIGAPSRDAR